MDSSGWNVQRAVRGAGACTDFPMRARTQSKSAEMSRHSHTGSFWMRHACPSPPAEHLCLSSVHLHLLTQQDDGGHLYLLIRKNNAATLSLNKKWKLVYCGVVFILAQVGSLSKP